MPFARALQVIVCAVSLEGPGAGVWLDVPFVAQADNGCGAACAAMILDYWSARSPGAAPPPGAASPQAELRPGKLGITASALEAYLRSRSLRVFAFAGQWSDLHHHVARGRPLVVALDQPGAARHFVVVAGVDPEQRVVLVNDPARRKLLKVARAEFERAWRGAGYWTLLAVPAHAP